MSIIYKFKITSSVLPTTLTYRFSFVDKCNIITIGAIPKLLGPLYFVNSASATDLSLINLYLQSKSRSKVPSAVCRRL